MKKQKTIEIKVLQKYIVNLENEIEENKKDIQTHTDNQRYWDACYLDIVNNSLVNTITDLNQIINK